MPPRRRSSSVPAPSEASNPGSVAPPTSTATSLLHSLQAWPLVVNIGGRLYSIDPAPASYWVAALISDHVADALLDMLDPQDVEFIDDAILDGELDVRHVQDALFDAVTILAGRPWWFVVRLLHESQSAWDVIGGYLALRAVRADQISLQAYLDALLAAVMHHVEPKNRVSLLARMKAPPAGVAAPTIDETREADAFMASMRGQHA